MTKIEQIRALVAAATNMTDPQAERQAAWNQAVAIKKASKTTFEKLGVSGYEQEVIAAAIATADEVQEVEQTAPRTLRDKVLALLATFDGGYAARIKLLQETFGITKANANYYVSRVAKGKK